MATAPLFQRGDTVYLKSSAAIGKLEGYRVSNIRQLSSNQWLYQIRFLRRPPERITVGDTIEGRAPLSDLFFPEGELIGVCEAIDQAILAIQRQITKVTNRETQLCAEDLPTPGVGEPKFNIDDIVYFESSARIGFLERGKIIAVFEVGVQSASQKRRYEYQISTGSPNTLRLLFREEEILHFCEATPLVLASLNRQLDELTQKRSSLCS